MSYRGDKMFAEEEKRRKEERFEDRVDRLIGIMTVVGVGALTALIVTGRVLCVVMMARCW